MSGADKPPTPMTREALRVQVLNFSASLVAPNCSLATVLPVADKVWAWVEGVETPPSKTQTNVAKGVARLKEAGGG